MPRWLSLNAEKKQAAAEVKARKSAVSAVAAVSSQSLSSHQHAPHLGSMPNMAVDEEQYDEVDYGIDPTRGSFETSPKRTKNHRSLNISTNQKPNLLPQWQSCKPRAPRSWPTTNTVLEEGKKEAQV